MTIREWLSKHLVDNGLWPQEAEAILAKIEFDAAPDHPENQHAKTIVEVFHENSSGYPPQLFAVMVMSVNHYAVDWIDTNKPLHWARLMFLSSKERDAILKGDPQCLNT